MFVMTFGTLSITLRNPDFGDSEAIEVRRINRKTRGLDLKIFRDPIWPKTRVLEYSFTFLSEDNLYQLIDFLDLTLGHIITFTDYAGFVRQGIIITPAAEVTEQGRFDNGITLQIQVQA